MLTFTLICGLLLLVLDPSLATFQSNQTQIEIKWNVLQSVYGSQLIDTFGDIETFQQAELFQYFSDDIVGYTVQCMDYSGSHDHEGLVFSLPQLVLVILTE